MSATDSSKTYMIPVSNGLFAHRKKIGSAIWAFLWLINATTKERPGPDGKAEGLVCGGWPVPLSKIADALDMSRDAIFEHLSQLTKAGYIRKIDHGVGRPNGYAVVNSKRYRNRRTNGGGSTDETVVQNATGTVGKNAPPTVVQMGVNRRTNGGGPSYKSPSIYKEEILQDSTRHDDGDDGPKLTAEMVAQGVKQELGLAGMPVMLCLVEICRAKLADGADPTRLRNDLVGAWSTYQTGRLKLKWTFGSPEKFYASDMWHDPDLWPWMDGRGPRAAAVPPKLDSLEDKLRTFGAPAEAVS